MVWPIEKWKSWEDECRETGRDCSFEGLKKRIEYAEKHRKPLLPDNDPHWSHRFPKMYDEILRTEMTNWLAKVGEGERMTREALCSELDKYEHLAKLRQGFVNMLSQYNWTWIFVAEFSRHRKFHDAYSAAMFIKERFIPKLYEEGKALSYFVPIERFPLGYGFHAHGLMAGVEHRKYVDVGKIWRSVNTIHRGKPDGYFYVRKFIPEKGAEGYTAKYVTKDMGYWFFSLKDVHKKGINEASSVLP